MSKTEERRGLPLLGNGENYIGPIERKSSGRPKKHPVSYEKTAPKLINDIGQVVEKIAEIPDHLKLTNKFVTTFRVHHDFLAKSYYPGSLFSNLRVKEIGSRRWTYQQDGNEHVTKMYFVESSKSELDSLVRLLRQEKSTHTKAFVEDVQKIKSIALLDANEVTMGFSDDWVKGRVELVLHPFSSREKKEALSKLKNLFTKFGLAEEKIKIAEYPNGVVFLSIPADLELINTLAYFNPLRKISPIRITGFPVVRKSGGVQPPQPPNSSYVSNVKVGVFDGGCNPNNRFLRNYTTNHDLVTAPPIVEGLEHGSGVTGAVLWGALNNYGHQDILDTPSVTVEHFRVLPLSDPTDFDLYEIIDKIEDVVPKNSDIKVFNLSLGPSGPILDDDISRFTYALDKLSWDTGALFVVAVGNDGELSDPRIQSPADMVNGLGVGAYTLDSRQSAIRASYSCIGAGREGCKIKPDVVAFGGCSRNPIHLIDVDGNFRSFSAGTSFASPIVSGRIGELMGRCEKIDSLLARALVIHSATNPSGQADYELGHGVFEENVDNILNCSGNEVTILYRGRIYPSNNAKLDIPIPPIENYSGNVELIWTIAIISNNNPLDVEDYTEHCIEDFFYPNENVYNFYHPDHPKNKETKQVNVKKHPEQAQSLLQDNWTQASLPKTDSGDKNLPEFERRKNFVWDTVVRRKSRKRASSLDKPFLILHGMNRIRKEKDPIEYAVVVTVKYPGYSGVLYDDIQVNYPLLQPIKIKARNELFVRR